MGVMDVLQWVGETLDKPGAAVRGLLAGRPDQLANLIPFSDTMGITDPRNRTYGRDLLEQYGMLGQNTPGLDMGDVAGFGVDLITDPLNFVGGGLFGKAALGASRANAANRGIQAANSGLLKQTAKSFANYADDVASSNAASQVMRANRALPEELLPQAQKVYRWVPDSSEVGNVGGVGKSPMSYGSFTTPSGLEDWRRAQGGATEVFPALKRIDNETLEGLIDEVADLNRQGGGREIRLAFDNESNMPYWEGGDWIFGSPIENAAADTMVLAEDMRFLNQIDDAEEVVQHLMEQEKSLKELKKYIDDAVIESEGLVGGHYSGDILGEILGDQNHPLHNLVSAGERIDLLGRRLFNEAGQVVHPASEASQAYYAVGKHSFPELPNAADGTEFPTTLMNDQTYLPHIAPKLQARPRWIPPALEPLQKVPKAPKWLLPMLGVQNAVASAGRGH